MPTTSRDTADIVKEFGVATDRSQDLDGYTTSFVTIHEGHWSRHSRDAAPARAQKRRRLVAALVLLVLLLSVPLWTPGSFGRWSGPFAITTQRARMRSPRFVETIQRRAASSQRRSVTSVCRHARS